MRQQIIVVSLVLLCLALWTCPVDACPTCKEAVAENGGNLVRGYFWSILFMMSMPFMIVGGLGSMFYLEVRRARRLQAAPPAESTHYDSVPLGTGGVS